MSLISRTIAALTGGVSQKPQAQRKSGDAEAQTNAYNHESRGLLKRPPTAHLAKLTSAITGLEDGFVHPITLSATERFLAVLYNGALAVYDAITGLPVAVSLLNVDSYLAPVVTDVVLADDTFTDTDLTFINAHVIPATGGLWDQWQNAGTFVSQLAANRCAFKRDGFGTTESYLWPDAPSSADYTVEATVNTDGGANSFTGVIARAIKGTGGYLAAIRKGSNEVRLAKLDTAGAIGATIVADTTTLTINNGQDYRLRLVVAGTSLKVYVDGVLKLNTTDATFAAAGKAGIFGQGSQTFGFYTYLDSFRLSYTPAAAPSSASYRAAQLDNQTVLTNRTMVVQKGVVSSANPIYQALVAIRQADYGTQYRLTIDNQLIAIGSPEGVTPQSRLDIDTTIMAGKLKDLIDSSNTLDAFVITQYGSTLLVTRSDGLDFSIAADDGLADNGLLVIKGTVQRFTDLPEKAPEGFIVEVTGDPTNTFDNFFVRFDVTNAATNAGVWKETVKPGEPISLDASTMPHVLVYKGSYVPDSSAAGTPPTPTIAPGGGALVKDRWDEAAGADKKILLSAHNDSVTATLDGANGIASEYTVYYDVDTRSADPENLANIVLYSETAVGSGVYTEVTRKRYGPELLKNNETISAVMILAANQKIRLRLEYANAVSPASNARAKFYTAAYSPVTQVVGGAQNATAIIYFKRTGKLVTFSSTRKYPQGALIRITCDAINFDYTPLTDVTGAAVATQLQGQIDAHATFVATTPASGQILVTRADAADTVVTSTVTWSELTTYHDPNLALTTNGIVGRTVRNLTDGSTGTVTANTPTTLSVTAMTGGVDNKFQKDDRIEVVGTGTYFTFGQANWSRRAAGDLTTNPLPSLISRKVDEVFHTRGRLGLLAQSNVVLSEASRPFNLFRTSVTQLLDSDPIDVFPAEGSAVRFHSAQVWNGQMTLWAGRQQYALEGDPILSPKTIKLVPMTEYPCDNVRPVALGRHLVFMSKRSGHAQAYSYGSMPNTDKPTADQITKDVPQYLAGNALLTVADEDLGMFVVLTDADRSQLYVYTYGTDLSAWTRWQFPAGTTISGLSFQDGILSILSKRSDGAYLDQLDMGKVAEANGGGLIHLDRRWPFAAGTGVFSAGSTTWTLPYSCATNGSEGTVVVVNPATGLVVSSTRPSATTVRVTGDYSAIAVVVGIQYTFTHTLSTLFLRVPAGNGEEKVIPTGRLQVRRLRVRYAESYDLTVTVTPLGRSARAYTLDVVSSTSDDLSVPVMSKNDQVTIVLSNATPFASRISGFDWEGYHYQRSRSA